MREIINEWRRFLKEENPPQAQNSIISPTRKIAAGMIVEMINQGKYPAETTNFIIVSSDLANELKTDESFFGRVKSFFGIGNEPKTTTNEVAYMLKDTPEVRQKLMPLLKPENLTKPGIKQQILSFFNDNTTQEAGKMNEHFRALTTLLVVGSDEKSMMNDQNQLVKSTYNSALQLVANSQKGDNNSKTLAEKYINLSNIKVMVDSKLVSNITDVQKVQQQTTSSNIQNVVVSLDRNYLVRGQ